MKLVTRRVTISLLGSMIPQVAYSNLQQINELTPEKAAKFAIFAMASSNAYHQRPPEKKFFPLDSLGWRLVSHDGKAISNDEEGIPNKESGKRPFLNVAYDILENNTNETIFAFRGTDSPLDYFFSNVAVPWSGAYAAARKEFVRYARNNRNRHITITGHSLGGGLALSSSVRHDVLEAINGPNSNLTGYPAIVFNSSPRVFDGFGDHQVFAERYAIYQKGEILQNVRKMWKNKFHSIVPRENIYQTEFDYLSHDGETDMKDTSHRADLLAYGILKLAATTDVTLAALLQKVIHTLPKK